MQMLEKIPAGHIGDPGDIVRTALFLIEDAPYINGQIIAVDGGLHLHS
jgi:pteridine reductase